VSFQPRQSFFSVVFYFGIVCLAIGATILLVTFFPVIKNELNYDLFHPTTFVEVAIKKPKNSAVPATTPVDANFGIVIPKIGANARIIPGVDAYDSRIYQYALTKGVAQAKGSSLPGQNGDLFVFAHSSVNFYDALRYNSIFYLLTKLEKNDPVYVFYQKKKYTYTVTGKQITDPEKVFISGQTAGTQTITLMTCWPPGTSIKRLLVFGKLTSVN